MLSGYKRVYQYNYLIINEIVALQAVLENSDYGLHLDTIFSSLYTLSIGISYGNDNKK